MTPHQLANKFCANFDSVGCAGLGILDSGQTVRLWPRRRTCTITQRKCAYFETCVAPHVRNMESGPSRDSWMQAINLYLRRLPAEQRPSAKTAIFGMGPDGRLEDLTSSRKCPECGKPMEARQRLCGICAKFKQREASRLGHAKARSSVST